MNLSIIILNWNNYLDTKQCIEQILKHKNLHVTIYLIDNNSQDGSGVKLKHEFSGKIQFYNSGSNLGYTGGNNFGIKKALENKSDFILVLNNDLIVENISIMLESTIEVFKYNPNIGIVGFDIFNYTTKEKLKYGNLTNKYFNKLLNIDSKNISLNKEISISNQRTVCGCAICFRNECINEIGLFDESFFMYAEEHDISLRAIKNKWMVVKVSNPNFKIFRKIDPISDKQLIWYYGTRNIFWAYWNNLAPINKYIFSSLQFIIYTKEIIKHLFLGNIIIAKKMTIGLIDSIGKRNEN